MNLLASLLTPLLRFAARKNLPKRRGTVHLPGLGKDVQVRWDPFAIPYISAHNEADLFFAQGYLHAQDRLWQMDLNRRVFSGRLAEILGDRPIPRGDFSRHLRSGNLTGVDHFMRVIGLRHTAALSLPLLSERSAQAVEAYCGGVNAYIGAHQRRLPVEFRVLRCEPAPWQPVDCLTLAKGFALFLSSALMTRLTFLALHARLENDPDKLRSLAPRYPSWGAPITRALSDHGAALARFIDGSFADSPWTPQGPGQQWLGRGRRALKGRPCDPVQRHAPPHDGARHLVSEPPADGRRWGRGTDLRGRRRVAAGISPRLRRAQPGHSLGFRRRPVR